MTKLIPIFLFIFLVGLFSCNNQSRKLSGKWLIYNSESKCKKGANAEFAHKISFPDYWIGETFDFKDSEKYAAELITHENTKKLNAYNGSYVFANDSLILYKDFDELNRARSMKVFSVSENEIALEFYSGNGCTTTNYYNKWKN